jgi:hypothetical protein
MLHYDSIHDFGHMADFKILAGFQRSTLCKAGPIFHKGMAQINSIVKKLILSRPKCWILLRLQEMETET